jgi:hypothetical protein
MTLEQTLAIVSGLVLILFGFVYARKAEEKRGIAKDIAEAVQRETAKCGEQIVCAGPVCEGRIFSRGEMRESPGLGFYCPECWAFVSGGAR